MKHIFELRMKDQIEERSSQLLRNLSSCELVNCWWLVGLHFIPMSVTCRQVVGGLSFFCYFNNLMMFTLCLLTHSIIV